MAQGRYKDIESPEQLWQLFEEYRNEAKANPRIVYVLAPKISEMIPQKLETPLTKEGFYNFVADKGIISTLKDYFSNREERYSDFVPIVSRICSVIRQDQIEGGLVGQYNSNLTARLNEIVEKSSVDLKIPDWMQQGIPKPDA